MVADPALQRGDDFDRFGFAEMDGVPDHLDVVSKKGLKSGLTAPIEASKQDQRTVECIRGLVLDCCQQHGIGHGGSAIGMAAIATALWRHKMRFDPANPVCLHSPRTYYRYD